MKKLVYSPSVLQELDQFFTVNPFTTDRKNFTYVHPSFISQACPFRHYGKYKWTMDDFEMEPKEAIGKGAYGQVFRAVYKQNSYPCAIKIVDKRKYMENNQMAMLFREIQLHHELGSHPQIVSLYGCFDLPQTNEFAIVMEYAEGVELLDYINNATQMSLTDVQIIFSQILHAVQFCHQNHIIHRDIKVENIKIDSFMNIKLLDFGYALRFEHHKSQVFGTFYSMAPEMCIAEKSNGRIQYCEKIDLWSCGVVLYNLMTQNTPFNPDTLEDVYQFVDHLYEGVDIVKANATIPFLKTLIPASLRHLFLNLFQTTPSKRYSIPELLKDVELFGTTGIALSRKFIFNYERANVVRSLVLPPIECASKSKVDKQIVMNKETIPMKITKLTKEDDELHHKSGDTCLFPAIKKKRQKKENGVK